MQIRLHQPAHVQIITNSKMYRAENLLRFQHILGIVRLVIAAYPQFSQVAPPGV